MGLIRDLKPLNLDQEKQKFFNNFSYNPQFQYIRTFTSKELHKYGVPKKKFFDHAVRMLNKHGIFFKKSGINLTQSEIEKEITNVFLKLNLNPIKVSFIEKQVSRVLIKEDEISFRSSAKLNKDQVDSIINHEIQTHYLRKFNHNANNLNKIIDGVAFRFTEEGLANMHSFIERKEKIIKKTYSNYLAVYFAQNKSFSEVFAGLKASGISNEVAWNIAVKQKRGVSDTSKPGGFSKDLVYFEGIVKIWKWMQNENNDPRDLYLGRIDIESIDEVKRNLKKTRKVILPTFMSNMENYIQNIREIGRINEFDKLEL